VKRVITIITFLLLAFISGKDYLHAGNIHACHSCDTDYAGSSFEDNDPCFGCHVTLTHATLHAPAYQAPVIVGTSLLIPPYSGTFVLSDYCAFQSGRGPPAVNA
jgi:hypothetical protein